MSLLKVAGTTASSGTLYVDDVFSTYLYTGNGSTQTITNGIDLAGKGGLVWCKKRDSLIVNGPHYLTDTNRGAGNYLSTNSTAASSFDSQINAFNSNGFSIGSDGANVNLNGSTYASWTFRKAAKFFDVVTYTGTGSARTIAHSLGVAPGMVIVKRTDTTGNWQVYSNGLTSAAYSIQLNLTNAQASAPTVWNSTAPTSSVFSVGTDATVNASGGTYVAYLFAHDTSSTGIIQCGSFTTDGSGNATVNLGWEPQFVLSKSSSAVTSWVITDTMRGMSADTTGNDAVLTPNLTAAETQASDGFAPNAKGFAAWGWAASNTYIYMAIRRPNKPPTSGTQVFSPNQTSGTTGTAITTGFPVDWQLLGINAGNVGNQRSSTRLTGVNTNGSSNSQYLITSSTAAEAATGSVTLNWGNTGYQVPSLNSGYPIIGWNFKRAPGFFDVVCYTGTGVDMTLNHNLGVVPELMIVKRRSITGLWFVYSAGTTTPNNYYLRLETTGAQANAGSQVWNNTATTFLAGTGLGISAASQTYVAYLFATLAGISKVGSYTGNGTGQAIACGFSAGARFVLIKRTDAAGAWYTFDSARGLTSGSSPYLLLNSTAAEVTGNNGVYASTGGFTLGSTASTTTNINAATYIFLAVA